jgi:hypothetical protein
LRLLGLFVCACARSDLAWTKGHGPTHNELDVIRRVEQMAEKHSHHAFLPDTGGEFTRKGIEVLATHNFLDAAESWCYFLSRTLEFIDQQCQMLRDIFGDPFFPFSDPCLHPDDPIRLLANNMYWRTNVENQLDPVDLSVLADMLEDVDCSNVILSHLHSPGPHWRGCWALDWARGIPRYRRRV